MTPVTSTRDPYGITGGRPSNCKALWIYVCLGNGYGDDGRRPDDEDRRVGRCSETDALKVASLRPLRCR